MPNTLKLGTLCVAVSVFGLTALASAHGAKNPPLAPAPVPTEIAAAKKVFISNGGGANLENIYHVTVVSGGTDRSYNQFYAAMKAWGRYDLVPSPADADLVFEISWSLPGSDLKLPTGRLRLVILDPKTRVKLWAIIEYAQGAMRLSNRDKNFDQAMDAVVDRLKTLVEPPATAVKSAAP
ncbi:MAG: hypothetical protein ACRD5K_04560 [Candidatus Acidiferrales bacterium]